MAKRLMTPDEYAAWQQNARKGFTARTQETPEKWANDYMESLKTLDSDKPTKRGKGKHYGR